MATYNKMNRQIFRKQIPTELLYEYFEQICLKTDKYYLVDHNAYKKFIYNNLHTKMVADFEDYYQISKRFYIHRSMTYNSFINIVRQICKANNLIFTSQIRYLESKYNIEYLVYF